MSEESVDDWLRGRAPEIPSVFLLQLQHEDGRTVSPLELAQRGEEALKRALRSPTGDRGKAFHLLAADAFLTYACEALARVEGVQSGLETLLARLGAEFR
jgi:hypothetical protein